MTERFEVTENHIKLAKRMYWEWNDNGYEGAPAVGLKRPYGNSDVAYDVVDICGLPTITDRWGEMSFTEEVAQEAMELHREMDTVMQILTVHADEGLKPGMYVKTSTYNSLSWRRVDE